MNKPVCHICGSDDVTDQYRVYVISEDRAYYFCSSLHRWEWVATLPLK